MKFIGIIPARYASTRFPGKPLADLCGKTVIRHALRILRPYHRESYLIHIGPVGRLAQPKNTREGSRTTII